MMESVPDSPSSPPPTPAQVEGLLALTRDLLTRSTGDEAYERILAHAIAAVPGAETGSVVVRGGDGRFRFAATRGFDLEALRSVTFEPAEVLADVAADGRAVVIRDLRARNAEVLAGERQRRLREVGGVDRIAATIAAPIVLDGEVVATLRLDTYGDPEAFCEVGCPIAEAYASQVGWVLARWQAEAAAAREAEAYRGLYAEAARRAREYEVLDGLRQAVAGGLELDEVLRLTADAVARALEAPMVTVYLLEEGELRLRHALGYRRVMDTMALGQGVTGRVAATGVPAMVTDVAADPDFLSPDESVLSEIAVPLVADGEVLGVLNAESGERVFGGDDLRLLLAIRDQVGIAVQRARMWASLRSSEARFRLLAEHARDVVCLHEPSGRITYVSPAVREVLGHAPEELLGKEPFEHVLEADRAQLLDEFGDPTRLAARPPPTYRAKTKDGRTLWLEASVRAITDAAGEVEALVSITRDVTERRSFEERLRRAALYDDLTGLPNRALLLDRLAHAIERRRRHAGARYALVFLDVDGFKEFNDSLGHAVGDALLQAFAGRLRDAVRAVDSVARLGGDEFCVLLADLESDDEAERTAARLQEALSQPFSVAGRQLRTSASLGVAKGRAGYAVPSDVLRDADIAMYRAKAGGTGRMAVFDVGMRAEAVARLELEHDLRRALEDDELDVVYQPVVRLADGQVVGFEALARWRHPTQGPVPPDVFVPLAESTGLIVAIDRLVVWRACRAMAAWRAAGHDWTLSVNVSSHHFSVGDVVGTVESALRDSALEPQALRLELTERVLLAHPDRAREALARLRVHGTLVQVDDFGTGYSSLAALQRLPIDALKLDRSFVAGLRDGAYPLVAATAQVAHHLGIEVVAEGIETASQRKTLAELGCRFGQGYLFARPLDEDEVPAWAADRCGRESPAGA